MRRYRCRGTYPTNRSGAGGNRWRMSVAAFQQPTAPRNPDSPKHVGLTLSQVFGYEAGGKPFEGGEVEAGSELLEGVAQGVRYGARTCEEALVGRVVLRPSRLRGVSGHRPRCLLLEGADSPPSVIASHKTQKQTSCRPRHRWPTSWNPGRAGRADSDGIRAVLTVFEQSRRLDEEINEQWFTEGRERGRGMGVEDGWRKGIEAGHATRTRAGLDGGGTQTR